MDDSLYIGREQSRVKHLILERYLQRFSLIIGATWRSITYVDCFSGPWKSKSESHADTSFAIAIAQLRAARAEIAKKLGRDIELRAFFIERNKDSFAQLAAYANEIDDVEINVRNADLEGSVEEILAFVHAAKTQTFPFVFIDPKGWAGFSLDVIRPLLKEQPCEILINFMTQHIVRFIDNQESHESFERLFGTADFAERLRDTKQDDRVDAAVFQYRDAVNTAGGFDNSGIAGILNPLKNRSHFHLIYLSRHPKGLEVFKEAEKTSMSVMETDRAKVEQARRKAKSQQLELFDAGEAPESEYYQSLRDRYQRLAINAVEAALEQVRRVSYDDAWNAWLQYPMVWESDLKAWIKQSDRIEIEGLTARQKVPKRGQGHFLVLTNS